MNPALMAAIQQQQQQQQQARIGGLQNRAFMPSGCTPTNDSLQPEQLGGVQCVSMLVIILGVFMSFIGMGFTIQGYHSCQWHKEHWSTHEEYCSFSGTRLAGVVLLIIGPILMVLAILCCVCVLRPVCCGFQMSEEMQQRYNQPLVVVAGYTGPPQPNPEWPKPADQQVLPSAPAQQPPSYYEATETTQPSMPLKS